MNKEEEEARNLVDQAIKELGLQTPLTDKQIAEEIDQMLEEREEQGDWSNPPYGLMMGEARRRFLYRADLSKVATILKKKLYQRE